MEVKRIKIGNVIQSKNNPRSEIGDTKDLEASIKAHGLISPITVCWNVTACKYEVIPCTQAAMESIVEAKVRVQN